MSHDYEEWLASLIPHDLVSTDLDYKHQLMRDPADPFPFFRATYFLWVKRWCAEAGLLKDAPKVLSVGDIHVENFGTWRDADGRLCWGVNDFDECDDLPYTQDLVRLAASVRMAKLSGSLKVKLGEACALILSGYRECLETDGMPFVLEENHPELRAMAMAADREPIKYWAKLVKLLKLPEANPPADARAALVVDCPPGLQDYFLRPRPLAGVGSLGRPRYVALADWRGGWVCREAKATAPPATAWGGSKDSVCRTEETVRAAVRSHDPYYRQVEGWVARRLAPRTSRIDLQHLEEVKLGRLLFAMGAEIANVHLGNGNRQEILTDIERRHVGWLRDFARKFADQIGSDWCDWRSVS